jgi:hypothetical protein
VKILRTDTISILPLRAISGDAWPELSDIEQRFTCRVCGKRGADAAGLAERYAPLSASA